MPSADRVELAVCAIVRDEASYLAEWVAFHELQGVERVRLYDNGSRDDPAAVLAPWIDRGVVELRAWPQPFHDGAQEAAYVDALSDLRDRCRWVAFLDVDEFLHSPTGAPLPQVLSDDRDVAGVAVRWQVYGSDGHTDRSPGLVTERFTRRAPTQWIRNRRTKCVVDPRRVAGPVGPHWFEPSTAVPIVDQDHRVMRQHPVGAARIRARELLAGVHPRLPVDPYARRDLTPADVRVDRLRINHYAVKSRAEYRAKRARFLGTPTVDVELVDRYDQRYFAYHDRNDVHDPMPPDRARAVREMLA